MKGNVFSILVVILLLGNAVIAGNFRFSTELRSNFAPPDTIKPRVDLLGIDTIIMRVGEEFLDSQVLLVDDVNSDAELRRNFFVVNNLPKNQFGNLFCAEPGNFKSYYWVRDLSNNQSDTVFRTILCETVLSNLTKANNTQKLNVRLNPDDRLITFNLFEATSEIVEVTILDILGNSIQSNHFHSNTLQEFSLPMPSAVAGIHLFKVRIGNDIYTEKIVLY